jgi:hypothetical protein
MSRYAVNVRPHYDFSGYPDRIIRSTLYIIALITFGLINDAFGYIGLAETIKGAFVLGGPLIPGHVQEVGGYVVKGDRGQSGQWEGGCDRRSPARDETVYPVGQGGDGLTDGTLGSFEEGFGGVGDRPLADGQGVGNPVSSVVEVTRLP